MEALSDTFIYLIFCDYWTMLSLDKGWSGRPDSNWGSPAPKAGALSQTTLRPVVENYTVWFVNELQFLLCEQETLRKSYIVYHVFLFFKFFLVFNSKKRIEACLISLLSPTYHSLHICICLLIFSTSKIKL